MYHFSSLVRSKSMGLTYTCPSLAYLGLSLRLLIQRAGWPSQPQGPSCEPFLNHLTWSSWLMAGASHTATLPQCRCQSRLHFTIDVYRFNDFEAKSNLRQKQERYTRGGWQIAQGDFSADLACWLVSRWGIGMYLLHYILGVKRQSSFRHK